MPHFGMQHARLTGRAGNRQQNLLGRWAGVVNGDFINLKNTDYPSKQNV